MLMILPISPARWSTSVIKVSGHTYSEGFTKVKLQLHSSKSF